MNATIDNMKAKPMRMVRIPEPMAQALEKMADEQFNTLAEQVKVAVREYLEKHQRLPVPPSNRSPKSSK